MSELRPPAPPGYGQLLVELKHRIQTAQLRASLAVNRELVLLYWQIGRDILSRQERESWGAKVIDRLAADLKSAFPDMRGFSPRNLKYMRAFAQAWQEESIVQQLVAQIPWGHNVRILDYVKEPAAREWYVRAALQHGWSRDVLVHQIESGLHNRQGRAVTNFNQTLPPPQSNWPDRSPKTRTISTSLCSARTRTSAIWSAAFSNIRGNFSWSSGLVSLSSGASTGFRWEAKNSLSICSSIT